MIITALVLLLLYIIILHIAIRIIGDRWNAQRELNQQFAELFDLCRQMLEAAEEDEMGAIAQITDEMNTHAKRIEMTTADVQNLVDAINLQGIALANITNHLNGKPLEAVMVH